MLKIIVPFPALSLNHSHISLKRGGRIKTNETRVYEEMFVTYLLQYREDMQRFLQNFNPDEHAISADYEFFFPASQFFTKKKRLNLSKLPDTDNLIKICQDLVFKNLLNDAHVIQLSACKLPTSKEAYIKISIEAIELPTYIDEGDHE